VAPAQVLAQAAQADGDPVDGCPVVVDADVDFIDY